MAYSKERHEAHPLFLKIGDPLTEHIKQRAASLSLSVQKYLLLLARVEMDAQRDAGALWRTMNTTPAPAAAQSKPDDDDALLDAFIDGDLT